MNMDVVTEPVPFPLGTEVDGWDENGIDLKYDMEEIELAQQNHEFSTTIGDLPDEVLENIFLRLSPYNDLDAVKQVCHRWNKIAMNVAQLLQGQFKQSMADGTLQCIQKTVVYNENGRIIGSWMPERFAHMTCYYNKSLYIIGGTTHTPTTFNDMWSFDLSKRIWSRIIPKGKYPCPKALASCVNFGDNLYVFGGWSHPCSSPLMPPWRVYDELHRFNVTTNKWSLIVSSQSPPPTAGHSVSCHGDEMFMFGGRTYLESDQSFPITNNVWSFDVTTENWDQIVIPTDSSPHPAPRYGSTQIAIDLSHVLIIGGCSGPNLIFSDVWLLTVTMDACRRKFGVWVQITTLRNDAIKPNDFHYSGCKVGDTVVFLNRSSSTSPYMGFLHFDTQNLPMQLHGIIFEASRGPFQHANGSGDRGEIPAPKMGIYALDISKVLSEHTVTWLRESPNQEVARPSERMLHSVSVGRAELILFGGYYREPNGRRCRVSNDIYILKPVTKTY